MDVLTIATEHSPSVWSIVLILCAGIFVQSAAGFAAGLLIVPALLWCGYTIPAAQSALLIATIPQNVWGVWSLRSHIAPKRLVWPAFARLVFLPIGIVLLHSMETLPTQSIRQIVGGVVLAVTISIVIFKPTPTSHLHPIWAWLAFPISGFLQGVVGMGGPAMVFWVQSHDWDTKQTRGFLFAMYLISLLPALAILYFAFGDRIVGPGVLAAASIPLLWVSSVFGLRFGTWLGRDRLRRLTLILLLLMGLTGLAAPWMR